jgi:hypothetical protein
MGEIKIREMITACDSEYFLYYNARGDIYIYIYIYIMYSI